MEWYFNKIYLLKELNILVKTINKIDNEPGDCIFGVINKCIRKITYYFFAIINEETASLGNGNFLLR